MDRIHLSEAEDERKRAPAGPLGANPRAGAGAIAPGAPSETLSELERSVRARVQLLEPNLVLYRELVVPTVRTVDIVFDYYRELSVGSDDWYVIVDLDDTTRPRAVVIRRIVDQLRSFTTLRHMAFVVGKNFAMRAAARFVVRALRMGSFSVSPTLEAARQVVSELQRASR